MSLVQASFEVSRILIIYELFLSLLYSFIRMAENIENEKKPDNAEINKELFQQSSDLKKKTQQTNKNLDELRRRTEELLNPKRENEPSRDG